MVALMLLKSPESQALDASAGSRGIICKIIILTTLLLGARVPFTLLKTSAHLNFSVNVKELRSHSTNENTGTLTTKYLGIDNMPSPNGQYGRGSRPFCNYAESSTP